MLTGFDIEALRAMTPQNDGPRRAAEAATRIARAMEASGPAAAARAAVMTSTEDVIALALVAHALLRDAYPDARRWSDARATGAPD